MLPQQLVEVKKAGRHHKTSIFWNPRASCILNWPRCICAFSPDLFGHCTCAACYSQAVKPRAPGRSITNWCKLTTVRHRFSNDRIFNRQEFHFHKNNRLLCKVTAHFYRLFYQVCAGGGDFQRTELHRCTLRFSHLLLVFQIGLSAFILDEFGHVDIIGLSFLFYCLLFSFVASFQHMQVSHFRPNSVYLLSILARPGSFLMRWRISWTTSVLWDTVGKDTPFQN